MDKNSFLGKTAIVTGAGQGIGFEICKQLVLRGARVILNDIDEELAREAAARIGGERCLPVPGDCSDSTTIAHMIETAGALDIVIANAGITLFGDFLDYPPSSFYAVMKVNLGGSFFLAQAAARKMKQQNEDGGVGRDAAPAGGGGSILFMSSVTGHQAHKKLAAYSMTKAALEMLARNLVIELSPYRINVNTIAPGATLTERTRDDADYERIWSSITPMGRPASSGDIAAAALFLVSDQARHITGQNLIIDGGWTSVSPSPF